MIPKHEFLGMGIQIDLVTNIRDVQNMDIVFDQRERHDQWGQPAVIISHDPYQLRFFVRRKPAFEMTQDMLKHIDMFADRRFHSEGLHQEFTVSPREVFGPQLAYSRDEAAQHAIVLNAMRQQQILVDRVESHHSLSGDTLLNKVLPPTIAKDSLDKVFSDMRITQPSFFFYRNQRKSFPERPGKQADPVSAGHAMFIICADPFQSAARRIFFEDVTRQFEGSQLV